MGNVTKFSIEFVNMMRISDLYLMYIEVVKHNNLYIFANKMLKPLVRFRDKLTINNLLMPL